MNSPRESPRKGGAQTVSRFDVLCDDGTEYFSDQIYDPLSQRTLVQYYVTNTNKYISHVRRQMMDGDITKWTAVHDHIPRLWNEKIISITFDKHSVHVFGDKNGHFRVFEPHYPKSKVRTKPEYRIKVPKQPARDFGLDRIDEPVKISRRQRRLEAFLMGKQKDGSYYASPQGLFEWFLPHKVEVDVRHTFDFGLAERLFKQQAKDEGIEDYLIANGMKIVGFVGALYAGYRLYIQGEKLALFGLLTAGLTYIVPRIVEKMVQLVIQLYERVAQHNVEEVRIPDVVNAQGDSEILRTLDVDAVALYHRTVIDMRDARVNQCLDNLTFCPPFDALSDMVETSHDRGSFEYIILSDALDGPSTVLKLLAQHMTVAIINRDYSYMDAIAEFAGHCGISVSVFWFLVARYDFSEGATAIIKWCASLPQFPKTPKERYNETDVIIASLRRMIVGPGPYDLSRAILHFLANYYDGEHRLTDDDDYDSALQCRAMQFQEWMAHQYDFDSQLFYFIERYFSAMRDIFSHVSSYREDNLEVEFLLQNFSHENRDDTFNVEGQGRKSDETNWYSPIVEFFSMMLFGKESEGKNARFHPSRARTISDWISCARNMDWLLHNGRRIVEEIYGWCYELVTGKQYVSERFANSMPAIRDWMKDFCVVLDDPNWKSRLRTDRDFASELRILYTRGLELNRISVSFTDRHSMAPFYSQLATLAAVMPMVGMTLRLHKTRQEPIWIDLHGKAGIGKTAVTPVLLREIYKRIYGRDMTDADRYEYRSENEYWDGYTNQKIVTIDDFRQSIDPNVVGQETLSMICMVNTFPWLLHMANAPLKDTTLFTAEFIQTTTNQPVWYDDIRIKDPSAFRRRRGLVLNMRSLRGETNCKFEDLQDIVSCARFDIFDPLCDPNFQPILKRDLTLGEVVNEIVRLYLKKKAQVVDYYRTDVQIPHGNEEPLYPDGFRSVLKTDQVINASGQGWKDWAFSFADYVGGAAARSRRQEALQFLVYNFGKVTQNERRLDPIIFNERVHKFIRLLKLIEVDIDPEDADGIEAQLRASANIPAMMNYHWIVLGDWCCEDYMRRMRGEKPSFRETEWALIRAAMVDVDATPDDWIRFNMARNESVYKNSRWFGTAVNCALIAIAVFVGYKVTKWILRLLFGDDSKIPDLVTAEASSGSINKKGKTKKKKAERAQKKLDADFSSFMAAPQYSQATEEKAKKIAKNVFRVQVGAVGCTVISCKTFSPSGRTYLLPKHMLTPFAGKEYFFVISDENGEYKVTKDKLQLYPLQDRDLVAFRVLDLSVPLRPDVRHLFVKDKDLEQAPRSHALFVSRDKYGIHYKHSDHVKSHIKYNVPAELPDENDERLIIPTLDGYMFRDVSTTSGDCGGIYLWKDESLPRAAFAIHTAGWNGHGFAVPLTQELLAEITQDDWVLDEPKVVTVEGQSVKGLRLVGTLPKGLGYHPKLETRVRKSLLSDHLPYPPSTAAARLLPFFNEEGERISPKELSLAKFNREVRQPSSLGEEVLETIADSYIHADIPEYKVEIYSKEDVIRGISGLPGMKKMDLSTSAGWPFSATLGPLENMIKVDSATDEVWIHELLDNAIEHVIESVKKKRIFALVTLASLKDERRDLTRVRLGKTRLFYAGPQNVLIVFKMFFGAWVAALERDPANSEIALGVNPHSHQWGGLLRNIRRPPNAKYICGDAASHDISLIRSIIIKLVPRVQKFYKDHGIDNDDMVYAMCESVLHYYIVDGNCVHQAYQGNCSGHGGTSAFSSVASQYTLKGCVLAALVENNRPLPLREWPKHFSFIINGDDHVIGVGESYQDIVNFNSIQYYMKTLFGMDYTTPDKEEEGLPFTPLENVQFLKRGFIERGGIVYAPLDENVIRDIPHWVFGPGRDEERVYEELDSCMIEWFHYGKKRFEKEKDTLNSALRKAGLQPYLGSWEDLYRNFYC